MIDFFQQLIDRRYRPYLSTRKVGRVHRHAVLFITLGLTHAAINAALLSVATAQRLAETGDPSAHLWDAR